MGVVARGVVAPTLEVAVLINSAHHLVVVLDDEVFGEGIPPLHHAVGIGDAFAVEEFATVGRGHLLDDFHDRVLVGEIVVLQLTLGHTQVANHHGIAGIDHVGHPVVHPKGRLEGEFVAGIVLGTEGVRDLCDAAIKRDIGYHVGIVAVEPDDTPHVVGKPAAHLAGHGEAALLGGNGAFAVVVVATAVLEMHGERTDGHTPRACSHVGGHVERGAFEMVAHVGLDILEGERFVGLNPEWQVVALVERAVDIGQVLVHFSRVAMVAEETPDTCIGITDILEIDGTIGIAEREFAVGSGEETLFASERNDIGGIDTFHFGTVDIVEIAAADAFEGAAFLEGELADATEVGMGTDAVVGDAEGNPYSTFAVGSLADDFHNPGFIGVADGDALATAVVAIFLDQVGHAADGFACRGRPLQGQTHETEIVEQTIVVLQFETTIESGFDNGDLFLIHQADNIVGVFNLLDVLSFVRGSPTMNGYLLPFGMATGRTVEQRAGKAETIAIVGTHDTAIAGGFFTHNEIGAGKCRLVFKYKEQKDCQRDYSFHDNKCLYGYNT